MSGARTAPLARGGVACLLIAGWLVVVGAGLAVELVHTHSHSDVVERLVGMFSLSYEQNVPTWYSSCLLLSAALAVAAIAAPAWQSRDRWRWHWWTLAVGFGFMSLDEAVELHENLAGLYGGSGVLYFDWIVPASIGVALIGLLFLPFIGALPAVTRRRFIAAGALFLTGALAMELPLGWWTEQAGPDNPTYAMIDLVEESLEMAGVSLFILALRAHATETDLEAV